MTIILICERFARWIAKKFSVECPALRGCDIGLAGDPAWKPGMARFATDAQSCTGSII